MSVIVNFPTNKISCPKVISDLLCSDKRRIFPAENFKRFTKITLAANKR